MPCMDAMLNTCVSHAWSRSIYVHVSTSSPLWLQSPTMVVVVIVKIGAFFPASCSFGAFGWGVDPRGPEGEGQAPAKRTYRDVDL